MADKTHLGRTEEAVEERGIQIRSANPLSSETGQIWLNPSTGELKYSDGYTGQFVSVAQGTTGVAGETGLPGPTGAQLQGVTGVGLQGDTGLRGPTGPASGPKGVTGIQGQTGPFGGPVGQTGVQGSTGVGGATGLQGAMGGTGFIGLTGALGNTGVQGATGTMGALGPTGFRGPTGAQGATGFGIQGTTGTQGIAGNTGVLGPQGGTGVKGETGPLGGPIGATGAIGNTGPQGHTGKTGVPGIQGFQGHTGLVGVQGSTGTSGPANVVTWATPPSASTFAFTTSYVDWPNATIVLPAGVWHVVLNMFMTIGTGAAAGDLEIAAAKVTDSSDNIVGDCERSIAVKTVAAIVNVAIHSLNLSYVDLTGSKTIKVRVMKSDTVGVGFANTSHGPSGYAQFYAIKIGN